MEKFLIATGKTIDLAIQAALDQLKMDRDSVSVEVLENAKSGFFGIGAQPAKVQVSYEVPDEEPKPALSSASRSKPKKEAAPAAQSAGAPKVIAPAAPKQEAPRVIAPAAPKQEAPRVIAPAAPAQPKPEQPRRESKPRNDRGPKPERRNDRPKQDRPAREPKPAAPAAPVQPKEYAPAAPGSLEEKIETFVKGLLEHMGSDAVPHAAKTADDTYLVDLVGADLGILIGRRGETLDAIQHLTNYAVNRGQTKRVRINVDAENYRLKREEALQRLAVKVAGKVTKYRRNITLEPMNAYERHVIHAALQDHPDVTTFSTGTEPNRRIVVAYSRYKQQPAESEQ